MPKEDENRKKRREREDEAEEMKGTAQHSPSPSSDGKFDELLQRAGPMIEQLNNSYTLYVTGTEKAAPIERRKALEQVMATLQAMSKPTPAALFKFSTLQARYQANKDRWDKLMKDLETGKLRKLSKGR